jgi:hypothetical protein
VRLILLRRARRRQRCARAARAFRNGSEIALRAIGVIQHQAAMWRHVVVASSSVPLVVRSGPCALCGAISATMLPIPPADASDELIVTPRAAGLCVQCGTRTVMLGAGHADR